MAAAERSLPLRGCHGLAVRALQAHRAIPQGLASGAIPRLASGAGPVRNASGGGFAALAAVPLLSGTSHLHKRRRRPAVFRCAASQVETKLPKPVPVILLSGFLGTGKTTLLRHWLETSTDRVGVVVNDVAAVNIDSKLVQQMTYNREGEVNAIQLQNGCACCSLGDELLVSIYDLIELGTQDKPFSKIVVELSGVAEPQRVKENFDQAKASGYYLANGFELSKVVTLLDASTFCEEYMEYQNILERDDLVDGDVGEMGDCSVVELLVEQAEAANIVVLNKTDLASKEQVEATRAVVKAINKKATVLETSYSKVALDTVLGEVGHAKHEHGGHEHGGHEEHGHDGGHSHASDCNDPECTDESHGHGHSHSHAEDCSDPNCSDASHGHSHSHAEDCDDPNCTDPSHGHSHSHGGKTTAEERFGIASFTYSARRPFSEKRFTEALKKWPVPKHSDLQLMLGDADPDTDHPMATVIRSKGFCWLEQEPSTRIYWSHAGKDMKLSYSGVWWGAMTEQQVKIMERLSPGEYERSQREEWDDECGDRRQELVFIGQRLQEEAIRALLDECLLTDKEMKAYKKRQEGAQGEWGEEMYQAAASPV
ncbi:unnamed protein product [Durusdinium trenchii]